MKLLLSLFAALLPLAGCGYALQGSHSPLLDKEQVRRIYVSPLGNQTYKAGVENVVYNALIRTLGAGRRVTLVQREQDADAVLQGTVMAAQATPVASTTMDKLSPTGLATNPNIVVATLYQASLACDFRLVRRNPPPGRKPVLWTSAFSRAKSYPASVQLDIPGTTSALINSSEFDRAVNDLAQSMMGDVHESMLAMF